MTRGPLDRRLLRHARASRTPIAALAGIGAGQACATLLLAVALARTVAEHLDGATVALLAGAYLARAGFAWAEQVVAQRAAARVSDELRRGVLAAALRRGPAWAARYGAGRLTAVLTTGLDALRPWFSGYLPALVLGVALPPLVVAAIAVVDPPSALIALATLPLLPVLGALIGWATQARARQRWAADARLAGHFLDVVRGLATLRGYGRAERQVPVVAAMTERHRAATMRVLRVAFLSSTALDLVGTLSVGLIAVTVGLRVAAGDLALEPALLVILLAPEAYRPLREMAARFHASTDATAVISDVDEVLTGPAPAGQNGPAGATGTVAASGNRGGAPGVAAADIRVRHPGATCDALVLPGLAVAAGEFVALRGASGAGKTTALRVLAGLQPPGQGTAIVTGPRPLYLPQRPMLPHARTVADVFARATGPRAAPDPAGIAAALRVVGLDGELGPGTALGEHGGGVSAGQRQRLALAVLLHQARREPVTLLLDEPTAHLDPAAEELVVAELRAAARRGCAVLAVAHRPALLAAADRAVTIHTATGRPGGVTAGRERAPAAPALPRAVDGRRFGRVVRRPGTAVVLGAAAWLAGIALTGAAAWLLVRAATMPPVLTLSAAVVTVRATAIARPLLRYLERLVSHEVAFARLGAWRSRVYADLIPRVPGPDRHRRGDLLTRVVDDVDARVDGLLRGRLPRAAAALTVGVAGVAAAAVQPAVLLPLAAGLGLSAVAAPALAGRRAARLDEATGRARAELRDALVESVDALEELAARDARAALAVPERRSLALSTMEARAAWSAGGAAALAHLGWGVAVVGTAAVLSAVTGVAPEWAAVLLLGTVALNEPVAGLPDAAVARRRAAGARARLAALAPSAPWTSAEGAGGTGTWAEGADRAATSVEGAGGAGVRVRGLVAGWRPDAPPALRGLDLDLPAGGRVAVLGASGSGKSTLAAVLARLLDPREGTVWIDGTDLRALPEEAVRGTIALVGDDTGHVFASTVRENLRLARPRATDADLHAVLARVGLGDWLARLPDGLDTWLGTGGATVSGGQRRRLATARALLAGPRVLILDEPTEGLAEDEAGLLMADLLAAGAGLSVLLFTHRREGLDAVDAVHVLTEGALAEPVLR
ncbi:ATP-binding cassette subfamily C protein CydCD [Krasilnikovia cinnamomea]|uniref:ATP-binding cassette subfamily C protein CydCD n=1 Tax=Krasilnikovia cinnamomea TaxID=349313 RepID=A0A4Q7ZDK8_9ACTN|nr:thiol reductant ABC exporter subunit CydC [Krasilnikovia cinnamomea]RZU48291.1 ATP-binding cassette subfamily C protein CydCD [Krasilnikovia cinnamomea]